MSLSTAAETLVSTEEVNLALERAAAAGEEIPSLDDAVVAVPVDVILPRRVDIPATPLPDIGLQIAVAVAPPEPIAEPDQAPVPPRWSLTESLLWLLDSVLGFIDLPFRRLSRDSKMAIFAAGVASLIVSVSAAIMCPLLFPPPDPSADLRAKVVAAQKAQQAKASSEAAAPAEGSAEGSGEGSGGHGAAPPPPAAGGGGHGGGH